MLVRGLLGDPAVPSRAKVALAGLVVYLVSPIDLVPDLIPVAGVLDDAILLALVLRLVLRSAGEGRSGATGAGRSARCGRCSRSAGAERPGGGEDVVEHGRGQAAR